MRNLTTEDATAKKKETALTFKAVQLIGRSTVVSYFKCNGIPSIGIRLTPENSSSDLGVQIITSVKEGQSGYYVNTNKGNQIYLTQN